jgi:predicted lipid-binding transport protein (Tim44 family)
LNIFERKVYRRILGPVYDNEKENWRILTNKEMYASVKKTYYDRDSKVK